MTSAETLPLSTKDQADIFLVPIKQQAEANKLGFAGRVSPTLAWRLFQSGEAKIIDVRTSEELKFVGYIPEAIHIPWLTGLHLTKNPRFISELSTKVNKNDIVFLLCRSGKRSVDAAIAAHKAGFKNIYSIEEGFEGDLNELGQRGSINGWRLRSLPWEQN